MADDGGVVVLSPEVTLQMILDLAQQKGSVTLRDGSDGNHVYVISYQSDRLSDRTKDFLLRGGPVPDTDDS